MEHLLIAQVGYDKKYYPRVNGKEDWVTANRYKDQLLCHPTKGDARNEGAFPPVVVVRATGYKWPYLLIDGLHRLRAFTAAGYDKIWADVERIPKSKWLARSAELNVISKRGLDSGDMRWVAKNLEAAGWEKEKIRTLLQMTPGAFERMYVTGYTKLTKKQAEDIAEGRSNREIGGERYGFVKTPFLGTLGTANASIALGKQGPVSSATASQIIGSFVALLECHGVDLTDEKVAADLGRAKELLDALLAPAA